MATQAAKKPAAKKAAATAAPAANAVAVRKPSSGAIVSIQEQLRAQAAALADKTQPAGGNKIRVSAGKFALPDGTETPGPLELVIVDFVTVHKFYEGKFDSKNIVPPGCFAIGTNPRQMTPSDNSPNLQSDSCQGCPMNEFGSSGEGKACKNGRLLAVLPPDADDKTDIWLLEVSPTALKGFDGYVNSVNRLFQMPPVGVVTQVSLDPNVDYAKLVFSDPQPNGNLEVSFGRQGEAQEMLLVEPDVSGYKAPARAAAPSRAAVKRPAR
jgi:hypothetical protein